MSFRGRLRLFFFTIVIVPMIAVALVLFALTAESETGKADAGIAAGLRTAFTAYGEASDRARPMLRRVAGDDRLNEALVDGRERAGKARMERLLRLNPAIVSIDFYPGTSRDVTRAGSFGGIAPASAPLATNAGARIGTLSVSVTPASEFAREVRRLSGLQVSVFEGGRRLATTLPASAGAPERGRPDQSRDFEIEGRSYRGRLDRIRESAGPPVEIAVFREAEAVANAIADNRLLIGGILVAFLLLALATSVFVVRALQGQIGNFLAAAQRLARGDFEHKVPTEGRDEFAALGREFNSMSGQLAAKIDEVERKRRELEETIRRVGAAFASGLDRQGIVELAVATAVDACEAEAGRALPLDVEAFREARAGERDDALDTALETAERGAFNVRPGVGVQLLQPVDASESGPKQRRSVDVSVEGAFAVAVAMRARLGSRSSAQDVGVLSIARRDREFTRQEQELLEYLAGQTVVSVENADLHETVQRQAVTDELTGLSNVRELHAVLDREVERSRRFQSPLGLVMLDIDNFKQVNDEFGHQQGDDVLAAVANVVRQHSRDIDEPARYGGEELAVVLPQTDSVGAAQLAERMREAVERLRVPRISGSGYLSITASFGVASLPDSATDKGSLIAGADAALYRAKRAGKNRVERAGQVPTPG
jgi:diguanylate cyclase (GGDEF)-like protein